MVHSQLTRLAAGAAPRAWVGPLVVLLAWLEAGRVEAAFDVSPPRRVGAGTAVVLRPRGAADERSIAESGDLLIHFHGAVDTIREALERAGIRATVVVVNQPGLSAAYAAPVREHPALFDSLVSEAALSTPDQPDAPGRHWRRITLSCFSAGYGAVREILRDPAAVDRIDAVVAADSIYAGIADESAAAGSRAVDPRDMDAFVAFAERAARGEKVFVVTHSAQPTSYASTTETADHLLGSVGLRRTAVEPAADAEYPQASRAGRGRFLVLGFAGASGPAHLFHLRSVDRWWAIADQVAEHGVEDGRPRPAAATASPR
ncbi:MAG: hypothetical protein FJ286_01470 [Planctomycetes bacterium]|nr:hypothetical protein [Planctomycetota bacterium]